MKITFLGTGAMQPTKERGLQSLYVSTKVEHILLDCGEGTQRQLKFAGLKATRINRILLSHYHGDHVLGMAGLLRSMGANKYSGVLHIYGPVGLKGFIEHMKKSAFYTDNVKMELHEIEEGIIFEDEKISIEARQLKHSVPCFGFSIIEKPVRKMNLEYLKQFGLQQDPILGKLQKGEDIEWKGKKILVKNATYLPEEKKVAFVFDTSPCKSAIELSKNADVLITESTFSSPEKEKAKEYSHLTSQEAAEIAKKAKVKKLILTHFSQRYRKTDALLEEAKEVFSNVECAEDFFSVDV